MCVEKCRSSGIYLFLLFFVSNRNPSAQLFHRCPSPAFNVKRSSPCEEYNTVFWFLTRQKPNCNPLLGHCSCIHQAFILLPLHQRKPAAPLQPFVAMASMNNLTTLIKRYAFCSVPQDRLVALQLLQPLRSPVPSTAYQPSADCPDQAGSCHLPFGGHGARNE